MFASQSLVGAPVNDIHWTHEYQHYNAIMF